MGEVSQGFSKDRRLKAGQTMQHPRVTEARCQLYEGGDNKGRKLAGR